MTTDETGTGNPRKLSDSMRKTLAALQEREGIIFAGASSGEIDAAGGTRATLYAAVEKGWARNYCHDYRYAAHGEGRAPRYYRTTEGTRALQVDAELYGTGPTTTTPQENQQ